MKLLIVGFNARPIAKAAIQAKHDVGVIDYFGDMDLLQLTKNTFSVLRQKPNQLLHRKLNRSPPEYLYYLAEIMSDEQGDFDGILLGSAFDRFPDLIRKFNNIGPKVFANEPSKFKLIRDKKEINKIAIKFGFICPKLEFTNNITDLLEIAKSFDWPLVTRRDGGGGGAGIRLWKDLTELKEYAMNLESDINEGIWIQEYINGLDASASVICQRKKAHIISMNQQLIGDRNLRAPSDFAYTGNIVPINYQNYKNNPELLQEHLEKIRAFFERLQLIGSNGIDFVLKDEKMYFMEINPRFQGSIECVQMATGRNIVELHLESFIEEEMNLPLFPRYRTNAVKGILFSDRHENFSIKGYPNDKSIVDRTHQSVIIEEHDPICSFVLQSKNPEKGYQKICDLIKEFEKINFN
ncbi:MAG: ATP-grasp domain-containing protein [Asgard group archaeon]|nr:ATP-grasp domain-containing protein [Asgard group archaeon]